MNKIFFRCLQNSPHCPQKTFRLLIHFSWLSGTCPPTIKFGFIVKVIREWSVALVRTLGHVPFHLWHFHLSSSNTWRREGESSRLCRLIYTTEKNGTSYESTTLCILVLSTVSSVHLVQGLPKSWVNFVHFTLYYCLRCCNNSNYM